MTIHEIIRKVLSESSTADQAHEMGLQYAGRGYWRDSSGKTVAKTVQDKLVKLEPGEEAGMASTTMMKTLPKDIVGTLKNMVQGAIKMNIPKDKILDIAKDVMMSQPEEYREEMARRLEKMYDRATKRENSRNDAVYRNPNFASRLNRPKLKEPFMSMIGQPRGKEKLGRKMAAKMFDLLKVSPTVSRGLATGNWPSINGSTTEGMYYIGHEYIALNRETLDSLDEVVHFTPQEIEELLYGAPADLEYKLNTLRSVEVLVHELCHAKDGSLANIINASHIIAEPLRLSSHRMLTEGLNERLARQVTWSCFSDDPQKMLDASPAYEQVMHSSYPAETTVIKLMIGLRPKVTQELWKLQTAEEREEYVKEFIETDFYKWLGETIGADINAGVSELKLNPKFALYILTHGMIEELRTMALNPNVSVHYKRDMIAKHLSRIYSHPYNKNE